MKYMEQYLLYGMIIFFIILVLLFIWNMKLQKKIQELSAGKNGSSLESVISENNIFVKKIREKQKSQEILNQELQKKLGNCIQNVSVVRFDALGDTGGKQSFAVGITDAHKNGAVISSMYTRNGVSTFAKEIVKGESKHKLTEEEKKVIS